MKIQIKGPEIEDEIPKTYIWMQIRVFKRLKETDYRNKTPTQGLVKTQTHRKIEEIGTISYLKKTSF